MLRNQGAAVDMVYFELVQGAYVLIEQITFGAPRFGNGAFALYAMGQAPAKGDNYLVTHIHDPIPSFPSQSNGNQHISLGYFITTEGETTVTAADFDCSGGHDE